jgi:hypothetical protein
VKIDPVQLLLTRICLCTSLAGTLAWIFDYSRDKWWNNVVGRNLATKTIIIALLLIVSLLGAFFRLTPGFIYWLRWADITLLAAIGPVMVWRMFVFRRVTAATVRCPAGHFVSSGARYCPQCGTFMPGAVPEERPVAD